MFFSSKKCRKWAQKKSEKRNVSMFFCRFGDRDLSHKDGHQFSDLFGGILNSGDGLVFDVRRSLVFPTSKHHKHPYNHCFEESQTLGLFRSARGCCFSFHHAQHHLLGWPGCRFMIISNFDRAGLRPADQPAGQLAGRGRPASGRLAGV